MNENPFDFKKFLYDSKETLLNPKGYFETMSTSGGMVEPILKALIYGTVAAIFNFLWVFVLGSALSFGMFGGAMGFGAFIMTIISALIGLFIGAVIILLISSICGGNTDFEANLRVSASLMVLMPINAILGVLGFIGGFVVALISIAIGLYGLYLLYLALIKTLKAKQETTRIVVFVLLALFLILQIIGFFTRRAARHFNRDLSKLEQIYNNEKNADNKGDYNYYSNQKPSKFPNRALDLVRDNLSKGVNMISKSKIERLVNLTETLSQSGEDNDKMLVAIQNAGYSDLTEYTNDYLAVISGITAVSSLKAIEEIIDASKNNNETANDFKVDEMLKAAAIQSILSAKLTESDLVTVYNYWDLVKDLEKKTNQE